MESAAIDLGTLPPGPGTPLERLAVAFQPVVDIHTGLCFGYEVLLRNHQALGHPSGAALRDACHAGGRLFDLELTVRRKAAAIVATMPQAANLRLFFNLDSRLADSAKDIGQMTSGLFAAAIGAGVRLVCEVAGAPPGDQGGLRALRRAGWDIAVDGFGADAGGLLLLCEADPDFVKIDRRYLRGIETEPRRRLLLSQMVATAHLLGVTVVAVGVETEREYLVCREVGCDLVQGSLVQPPVDDPAALPNHYALVAAMARRDRRRRPDDQAWLIEQLEDIPPLRVDSPMVQVFDRFAADPERTLLPVVDDGGQPLGLVREQSLKHYAYSVFGRELINNRGIGRTLRDFLSRCPVVDLGTPLDQIMAVYSADARGDGIIVTDHLRYVGFLSARAIIRAIHERSVAAARDENPLTKLPGNAVIHDYVAARLAGGEASVFAYIDFDNFKPFNDAYGFRLGDRAILRFAELMREAQRSAGWFLGHIGGDDFFVGLSGASIEEATAAIRALIARFAADAESFYDASARMRGHILAKDREGRERRFPLLTASAVLIAPPTGCPDLTVDDISAAIASSKKEAKTALDKIAVADCRQG